MVGLVIAAVSALAAVLVIPEVRQWLRLDTPPAQRESSPSPPGQTGGTVPNVPIASLPREITTRIGMQLVLIPAGEFQMGSTTGGADEGPVHRVRISKPFYLSKYEVTQAQWEAVMGTQPSKFRGDANRPVANVSWEEAQEFLRKLNAQEGGRKYRLPTEAEWEYAARAGSTTAYSFGDDARQLGEYAWYDQNAGGTTHPVGQKRPNAWGLYDMHGNVWEWVQDWKGAYTAGAAEDPTGPSTGALRVIRGGSWYFPAQFVRAAYRLWYVPGYRVGDLGFRPASSVPSQ